MSGTGKHFVNDPTTLVASSLRSIRYSNPSVAFDEQNKVLYLKSSPKNVAVVSGGGAGHEPSFAGFVGEGMLRAAVSGTIFSSPSVKQIHNCISLRVSPNSGVLLVVMNYTGDVLHFGLATEKARAQGLEVGLVVVGDDVGVRRTKGGRVGRRGIAGTVLVHKIAGALAATGASLKEVSGVAELVARNLVSVGSSLAHVHVPGTDMAESSLKEEEIELGMGIHNEQGSNTMKVPELPELVEILLKQLLDKGDEDRYFLEHGSSDQFALLVNNLGGVSPLELGAITAVVVEKLGEMYGVTPQRIYSGTYMTSLNGNGFSISLLKLINTGRGAGKSMLELLDAPCETNGWTAGIKPSTWSRLSKDDTAEDLQSEERIPTSDLKINTAAFVSTLSGALEKVIDAKSEINQLDAQVGDGDCGTGLGRGADAVLQYINNPNGISDSAVTTVSHIAAAVEETMDGTSGALYSIFINALVGALRESKDKTADVNTWATAAAKALEGLRKYTPARPGDRTLVDALHPFLEELGRSKDLKKAARKAREGAQRTVGMEAKLGRTVYVEKVGDVADPGAVGIAYLAEGLAGL